MHQLKPASLGPGIFEGSLADLQDQRRCRSPHHAPVTDQASSSLSPTAGPPSPAGRHNTVNHPGFDGGYLGLARAVF